jgi:hypothetical protein
MICAPCRAAESWGMPIRLIKHEAVPQCGSFEVRFSDGRPSRYFYWVDNRGRRLRPELLIQEEALEQARKACQRRTGPSKRKTKTPVLLKDRGLCVGHAEVRFLPTDTTVSAMS